MVGLATLAWVFFKTGLIFVGGGYVLIPLLHRLMVDQYRWLDLKQFLDGVALSQLTPGPIAVLATFSGFRVQGVTGALIATIAIFLPCTLLMLTITSRYDRFRSAEIFRKVLDGILPAVVGLVAAAALQLGKTSLVEPRDLLLLIGGFTLLQFTRVSPMIVILGAGAIGFLLKF